MDNKKACSCCSTEQRDNKDGILNDYVCYCNKVTKDDIKRAVYESKAKTVDKVVKITGAMKNSNCAVNNPKGVCCYNDIVLIFNTYKTF